MDFTAIATKPSRRAFTLVELLIAIAIGSILLIAVMSLTFYSARSFAALTNYVDLDNHSRNALDHVTREIRQADRVLAGSDERTLHLQVTDPVTGNTRQVTYSHDPAAETLTRIDGTGERILLRECYTFRFTYHQRNASTDWEALPATTVESCKQVRIFWECGRSVLGARVNTESVQSARVVLRKR
jgi:prepilin-type N-terminal cleavage/methylation domain-containing protein